MSTEIRRYSHRDNRIKEQLLVNFEVQNDMDWWDFDMTSSSKMLVSTLEKYQKGFEYEDLAQRHKDYVDEWMTMEMERKSYLEIVPDHIQMRRIMKLDRCIQIKKPGMMEHIPSSFFVAKINYENRSRNSGESKEEGQENSNGSDEEHNCQDEYLKVEKFKKYHKRPKTDKGKLYPLHMEWELVDRGHVEYDHTLQYSDRVNGQMKLASAFLEFVMDITKEEQHDRIVVYGAAPGLGIIRVAEQLQITLVCVDEYPMYRNDKNIYLSFDQFEQWNCVNETAVFFDYYDPQKSNQQNYEEQIKILQRFSPTTSYSLKAFSSLTGTNEAPQGSVVKPMIYTKVRSLEYRQQGQLLDNLRMTGVRNVDSSLRMYNQASRQGSSYGGHYVACGCMDCSKLNYILVQLHASSSYSYDHRDIRNVLSVVRDLTTQGYFQQKVRNLKNYSPKNAQVYQGNQQFFTAENFVCYNYKDLKQVQWKKSATFIYNEGGGLRIPINLEKGQVDSDHSALKQQSLHSDITRAFKVSEKHRYNRPAKQAVLSYKRKSESESEGEEDDDGSSGSKMYAIPRIKVTAVDGREVAWALAGENSVYTLEDISREPPCAICGAATVENPIRLRAYLSIFMPDIVDCEICDTTGTWDYREVT